MHFLFSCLNCKRYSIGQLIYICIAGVVDKLPFFVKTVTQAFIFTLHGHLILGYSKECVLATWYHLTWIYHLLACKLQQRNYFVETERMMTMVIMIQRKKESQCIAYKLLINEQCKQFFTSHLPNPKQCFFASFNLLWIFLQRIENE